MRNVKTCEICGVREAKFVCSECGREVCPIDFDTSRWICIDCINKLKLEERRPTVLYTGNNFLELTLLSFLAFILIVIGFFILTIGNLGPSKTITIIFPFLVTSDPILGLLAIIAIIIVMLVIFLYFLRVTGASQIVG